ncbi:hypothetical protein B0T46_22590, partial [Nocardia donostiensis]
MTRDLPFDGEEAAAVERGGDTAYRVASGVARVARGGAYVTGGALVAANGGGVPAQPGSEHLDSRNTGWARNSDPDPDVPSPVVTFPDPAPLATDSAVRNQPGFDLPDADATMTMPLPRLDGTIGGRGTDAGFGLPSLPDNEYSRGIPGTDEGVPGIGGIPGADAGEGVPGIGGIPGTDGSEGIPGVGGIPGFDEGFSLPSLPGTGPSAGFEEPGGHGFGLPGHGLGQAGHGFGLPDMQGFVPPGSNPFALPSLPSGAPVADTGPAVGASPLPGTGGGPFDGVGDGPGIFFSTETHIDFGIGPDGFYFVSSMEIDVAVGNVGDQLDQYNDWLADGLRAPDGAQPGADQGVEGGQQDLLGALTGSPAGGLSGQAATGGPGSASPATTSSPSTASSPGTAPAPAAAHAAPSCSTPSNV